MNGRSLGKMVLAFGSGALVTGFLGIGLPGLIPGIHATPLVVSETDSHDPISYRQVVRKVLPSVVSIEIKSKTRASMRGNGLQGGDRLPPGIPEEFRRFFGQFPEGSFHGENGGLNPMPEDHGPTGMGSGFIINSQGTILTNAHVVDGAEEVTVRFQDGKKVTSRDFKADPKTDIAVIRLSGINGLPPLSMGNSDTVEVGDRVLAVGAPLGLTGTVTHGIISHKGRNMRLNMYEDFLQTDAAINPGNSGGPLVNMRGEVIGVNSAIKSRTGGFQGIGLAIASNLVSKIKDKLLQDGFVKRGYVGIQIRDLDDPALASKLNLKENHGVLITQVLDKGPASVAGVLPGDVVIGFEGKPVKDGKALQTLIADAKLETSLVLRVMRDGKPLELTLTVKEQPNQMGLARGNEEPTPPSFSQIGKVPGFGLEMADLTPDLADKAGFKAGTLGALVMRVEPKGPAHRSGLRAGVLIQKVDGKLVSDTASVASRLNAAKPGSSLLLQVLNPEGDVNLVVINKVD